MSNAVLKAWPGWVTNGRRSDVIAMLGSSLRMLQFRPGMDGLSVARNEEAGPISYHIPCITYLAVRGIHIISSSKIKPENRVPLYTFMFARAFGIFCCLCLISYHIHTWQFLLYISFRLQKLHRKIAYCCIRSCSLVLPASSAVSA